MFANSRPVYSSEQEPHAELELIVRKHLQSSYQQPLLAVSETIFANIQRIIEQDRKPLILDSGCGTGYSSQYLASQFADHWVIGIDKSIHRLRQWLQDDTVIQQGNLIMVHADVVDIWRLAVQQRWKLARHYLLYPNPWPKKKHVKRRWYAHPVLPDLLALGGRLECRSNWPHYISEFSRALSFSGCHQTETCDVANDDNISLFEKKYRASGHDLKQLVCDLSPFAQTYGSKQPD